MIRVLVADDHDVVLEGIRSIIEKERARSGDIQVCAETKRPSEVARLLREQGCNVVILDISFEGDRSGLDVLKELKQQHPAVPVLMLSMHAEEQYAVRVLKAGAAGYLTKGNLTEQLIRAIRKVRAGGRYITESVAEKLLHTLDRGAAETPHLALSDREYQVMRLLAAGKTVKEIAAELHRSEKTIYTYRERIFTKMNMEKKDILLTLYARKHGLLSEADLPAS